MFLEEAQAQARVTYLGRCQVVGAGEMEGLRAAVAAAVTVAVRGVRDEVADAIADAAEHATPELGAAGAYDEAEALARGTVE